MSDADQLVGREALTRLLADRLDEARTHGRALVLAGEAGVGKSALRAAGVDRARTLGYTVLSARGSESEIHLPFGGLHQLLRPV